MRSLLSTNSLPWPADWPALFGTTRPLIVEIGFGYGHFLFHLAEQHPDANIVGIEIANKPFEAVERRLARRGYPNVVLIRGTAETALAHLFQPLQVTAFHINFPDPWFKKGHHHRRLMKRPTVDTLVSRLIPGGMLYLATDIRDYADLTHDLLSKTPGLTNTVDGPWVHEMPGRIITKYERRAIEEGRARHYFAYRRNDTPTPDVPVIKERAMPHVVFQSPLSADDMVDTFRSSEHHTDTKHGPINVKLMSAYRGRGRVLLEVYINEPTIDQHIALLAVPKGDTSEWTLQLSSMGFARPTDGVHFATTVAADVLAALHPDGAVLSRKTRDVTA